MQFKVLLSAVVFALILGFASNSLANRLANPTKCPSTSAILQVGLHRAHQFDLKNWWGVTEQLQYYDTKDGWQFKIGKFSAKDELDAITKAHKSLQTLRYKNGPNDEGTTRDGLEVWSCNYLTADGYQGEALHFGW